MKSMQQVIDDMKKYFSEVNAEGIDGADYVNAVLIQSDDDVERSESLYITFFKGEDRVKSWYINLMLGEESDLT